MATCGQFKSPFALYCEGRKSRDKALEGLGQIVGFGRWAVGMGQYCEGERGCDTWARIVDRRYAHESYGRIDVWLSQTAQASSVSA